MPLDGMPTEQLSVQYVTAYCMLSLTSTASCFLTGWRVAWTTSQRAKQGCCSAVEHKSLLSSSRRRQANWCSAGVETKAAVMSLQGQGGLCGGMPPPTPHQPVCPPFLPPSTHSPPTTPLPVSKRQLKYWMCMTSAMTKNDTVPHLRGALVKTSYE